MSDLLLLVYPPAKKRKKKRVARKKRRTNRTPRTIPRAILNSVPPGHRRALIAAIRHIGGWDSPTACGEHSRLPRRTFPSARRFVRDIEDEAHLDFSALDPAPMRDSFCERLELRGKRCPDTNERGGVKKAVRIGLGSKTRRLDLLPSRPEWQALNDALEENYQIGPLQPQALRDAVQHARDVEDCKPQHADERAALVAAAKRRRRKKQLKSDVPF